MTPEQLTILKTSILTSTDQAVIDALAIRNDSELVRLYNLPSAFVAWRKDTSKSEIFGAITWKSFTPADVPDGTQIYMNRVLACQSSQFNLQTMLISPGDTLDISKPSIRTGIKDALQNLPAGAGGVLLDAGWSTVKDISIRFATVTEQLFATGTGTNGSPGVLEFEGSININDMGEALNG